MADDGKYNKAWGNWQCNDCGQIGEDLDELREHDCDEHHKKARVEHEQKFFS